MNLRWFESLIIAILVLQFFIIRSHIRTVEAYSPSVNYGVWQFQDGLVKLNTDFMIASDNKDALAINLPFVVYVHYKGKTYPALSYYSDVNAFLRKQLGLDKSFFVNPVNAKLRPGSDVYLHKRTYEVRIEYETVPYHRIVKADPSLPLDTRKLVRAGHRGRVKLIKQVTLIDGVHVGTKVIDRIVEVPPVDEVIALGTKKVCKTAYLDGKEIRYWKKLHVWATSYDHTCYGCSHWTATGKYLTNGIIAVDPRVIDMHTTVYVPGYGFGQAEDTGGAIKGNHIDLGFEDLRKGTWSARWVDIYLIDHCMPEVKFNWRTKWDK